MGWAAAKPVKAELKGKARICYWFDSGQARQTVRWGRLTGFLLALEKERNVRRLAGALPLGQIFAARRL